MQVPILECSICSHHQMNKMVKAVRGGVTNDGKRNLIACRKRENSKRDTLGKIWIWVTFKKESTNHWSASKIIEFGCETLHR